VLYEFDDLMLEDLPPTFPLLRHIQHHIDFITWSSLPNWPAYHLSLKKFEELQ